MDDCIFCRILTGMAPSAVVYRDGHCAAFMDVRPVIAGHVLVVPIRRAPYLADLPEDAAGHWMRIAHRLAASVRSSGLRCEGVSLLLADGVAAGQEVLHTHMHVLPRYLDDGFGLRFGPKHSDLPSRVDLEKAAPPFRQHWLLPLRRPSKERWVQSAHGTEAAPQLSATVG